MRKLIVLFVILIFIILVYLFLHSGNSSKNPSLNPNATPLPTITSNKGSAPNAKLKPLEITKTETDFKTTNLINKLPYSGNNFSLFYSFSTNQFTLYINPNNQSEGNSEFDSFLKSNDVADRSWIQNLVITTIPITPQP